MHRTWVRGLSRRRLVVVGGTVAFAAGGVVHHVCSSSNRILLEAVESPKRREIDPALRSATTSDAKLYEHAGTFSAPPTSGIARYDVCQTASNNPNEDERAEAIHSYPNGYWSLFSVFDGHWGPQTSTWLRENFLYAIIGGLVDLYSQTKSVSEDMDPTAADVERTLKATFKDVDNHLVHETVERVLKATSEQSQSVAATLLAPALSGSCATLAFYDSYSRSLHVACTGDSRAVLGRKVPDANGAAHAYEVRELSVDQNGANPAEEMRLLSEHPGESVVKNGRVLGWGISRAFADANYKLGLDVQEELRSKSLLHFIPSDVKTPPYFTAEPEVTTTRIEPGDFLIIASDGLWECLGSHEAVGLVGLWLDAKSSASIRSRSGTLDDTYRSEDLPIAHADSFEDTTVRYRSWGLKKQFVNVDTNAATHLMRNALCGVHDAHRASILRLDAPHSRNKRDDITVTVVFFD